MNFFEYLRAFHVRVANINSRVKVLMLKTPIILTVFITNRCNARCLHCFYWKEISSHIEEIRLADFEKFASSLKHPLSGLILTGGEPFLRDDLPRICEIFCEVNKTKAITIPTNGFQPDKIYNMTKEILENSSANTKVIVSLDGLKKMHDEMRGIDGIFERAVETVIKLKELSTFDNFRGVDVATTISNANYLEVVELSEYVQNILKVPQRFQLIRGSRFSVQSVNPDFLSDFNPRSDSYALPPMHDLDSLYLKIRNIIKKSGDSIWSKEQQLKIKYAIETIKSKRRMIQCLAGKVFGVVYPSGDVSLCELTKPIGNLKETDFDFYELWISDRANKMREQIKKCFCTDSCSLLTGIEYDPTSRLEMSK